jgi:hypothetical protein
MKTFSIPEQANNLNHSFSFKFLLMALTLCLSLLPNSLKAEDDDNLAALSCLGDVQVSIALNGTLTLTPQMLLTGNYPDYGIFIVDIEGPLDDVLTCDEIDQSFTVSVIDTTNQNSCWSTVHVEDKIKPQIDCTPFDIMCSVEYSDEDYSFFITVSDNCTPEEELDIWYNESVTNLDCDPDNAAILERTWYVTDESGNQRSCEQVINIIKPDLADVVFPSDTIVYCPIPNTNPDSLGVPTIGGIPIDPFCEIVSWHTDLSSDICNGSFVITRTWNVMDWCDLTTVTDQQTITVLDTTPPVLLCLDDLSLVTAEDNCEAPLTLPESGATDSCGEDSLIQIMIIIDGVPGYMEGDVVDLDVGNHLVSYRATDDCGNVSTCSFNAEVLDTITPVLNCLALVDISTGGDVNLAVDAASFPHIYTDNCGLLDTLVRRVETHCNKPADLEFGPGISFCCEDVNVNVVAEMLVIDESGNSNSCVFEIDFTETEPPTVTCKDTILFLDENGMASVNTIELYTEIDDNCIVDTVEATINVFTCLHIGVNDVVVTVTDEQGNTGTCIAQVTVLDTIIPICQAMDITIALDPTGNLILTGQDMDDGSTDGCGIDTYDVSPSVFDCTDIGTSTQVTLTVSDGSGNSSTCTSMVAIIDTTAPVCISQDVTVELDEMGSASITANDVNNGSNDECSAVILSVSPSDFGCVDVGDNTVVLVVSDDSGNQSTCEAIVTVQDTTPPMAVCQDITIYLDGSGNYNLAGAEINNGSSDNCNIASLTSVPGPIDCSDLGLIMAILTVTDDDGNTDTCEANVTVQDTTSPIALCQDITIILDPMTGEYNLDPLEVNNGSNDNCDSSLDFSVNPDMFDCDDLGNQMVTLTVMDDSGNSDTCEAVVTVTEMVPPMCFTMDITVYVDDNGMVMIDSNAVDNNSIDPCGTISEITVSPDNFDCSNLGDNDVVMTVMDAQGNTSTCDAIVTVQDTTTPICLTMDITVSLDGSQMASITGDDINNNSSDNCGSITLSVIPNTFDCSDIGVNTVTLSVEDGSANISTCDATVTVQDTTSPIAICQDITVFLDDLGSATISPGDVDNGSNDDCSPVTLSLDNDLFLCNDVGDNQVILTATDDSGNESTCEAIVTVQDTTSPMAVCQDITIQLDNNGQVSINGFDIDGGSTDNCTIISLVANPTDFSCANLGSNTVELTVTDINSNVGTCEADVTVSDTIPPVALCQDITVQLDGSGQVSITGVDIDAGSSDNCNLGSLLPNPSDFDCSDLGDVDVILMVTDNSMNESTCLSVVTVQDTVSPVVICQDVSIYLDDNGVVVLDPDDLNNSSTDNCPDLSFTTSETDFSCLDLGDNDVTLYATDGSGNIDSCASVVTVLDTVSPVAICQDITIQLDNNGDASIVGGDINNGSTDNCNITDLLPNPSQFDCSDVGDVPVVLTVRDDSGNESTCDATVTVQDTVSPIAICQDITIDLDVNGMASISPDNVNNGSNDACGISNTSLDITDFTCMEVGIQTVNLTVEDNNGNTSTCSAQVTVEDNVPPDAICQDITIFLDDNGNASITGTDIDGGSTDACVVISLLPDITDFTCADLGDNTVVLTVTDANSNSTTCNSVVSVQDTISPICIAMDITVSLDGSQMATITGDDVNNNSSDNCGVLTLSVVPNTFDCSDIGVNMVTLSVEDGSANISSCEATVTVQDTTSPVAICQDITIYLDDLGSATINPDDVDNGSNDDCSPVSLSVDIDLFFCNDAGDNSVILTVADDSGNSDTCEAIVTVQDTTSPMALCQDITIQLDVNGEASITGPDIDGGSTDNCTIISLVANPTFFNCANLGSNPVELTVTDNSTNVGTCIANVTVSDTIPPNAICQDITVQLDDIGQAIITGLDVDGGSTDNCNLGSIIPDPAIFDCSDLGDVDVILTVTDNSMNVATCLSVVTVQDTVSPMAICQGVTVYIDENGIATVNPDDLNNGSTDNCISLSFTASETDFTCSDLGANNVTLYATDGSGNVDSCSSVVTVLDTISPIALCQDITIQLDNNGGASILGSDIDNNSSDNCSVVELLANPSQFDCGNIGDVPVVLTVRDASGNESTCDAIVTVQDSVSPIAICQDITAELDVNGMITISPDEVNNGSNDACGILNTSLDITDFTCSDVGLQLVILTVEDNNGNISTCSAQVSVEDNVVPNAVCQDITIFLDDSGNASISGSDIDGGSTDACIIISLLPDVTDFTCSDVGDNDVVLTVTDANNNDSTCDAIVTVQDTTPPIALCQDITIQLDVNGNAVIVAADVDAGSTDACGPISLSLDNSAFTCVEVGDNIVTLSVTDNSGNIANCTSSVTVGDTIPPVALCMDITIQLDNNGTASISPNDIDSGSSDACDPLNLTISISDFTCTDLGSTSVTLTVTDANSNVSTCTSQVTIEDNISPMAICQDVTLFVDDSGNAVLDVNDVDNGSSDNCSDITLSLDIDNFDCSDIGNPTTVTLTVTDGSLNANSCSAQIVVADTTSPIALCQDITIQLDPPGNAIITGLDIDNGSSDNCNIASIVPNPQEFDCNDIGDNSVILSVTDDYGNIGTCESMVTVQDTTPPIALCQDITIQLDGAGIANASPDDVDNGSADECALGTISLNVVDFDCNDVGVNPVILSVEDGSGNIGTCNADITVEDNVPPNVLCQDITIQLDATGNESISANDIDNGSTDNCGIQSLSVDPSDFTCADIGVNQVTLTVTDVNGNISSCTASVTVEDTTPPVAACQDITVQLDINDLYNLSPEEIDNGSSDNCDQQLNLTVNPTQLTCLDIGIAIVTLTVTDNSGNSDTCNSNVTVTDNVAPTCISQDITVFLDANGTVSIDSNAVDGGSSDACGTLVEITTTPNTFNCANLGVNVVTMNLTDNSGNQSNCMANVTVEDTISPVALCQDITIQLDDMGNASISANQVDNGSTDNCTNISLSANPTAFNCADIGIASTTLTVTDDNANSSTCAAMVTVQDITPPIALCQDITIQLDDNGSVVLTPQEIDNGSNDICSAVTLNVNTNNFNCSDIGINQVILTVTDGSGNNTTCESNVTVEDLTPPTAMCQDATVQLESDGTLILFGSVINDNSTDNCNISSLLPSPGQLDCEDIGTILVVLTVSDASGNSSTCESFVTVEDVTPPVAICQDLTVILDETGSVTITPAQVDNGSTDECDLTLDLSLDQSTFFCNDLGNTIVNLTVTDDSDNSSSCTSTITVIDTIAPACVTQDITVYLDDFGTVSIDSNAVDGGSSDLCGFIIEITTTPNSFTCSDVGPNIVNMEVTDDSGNQSSCFANVAVQDTTAPVIICNDITVNIQSDGTATVNVLDFITSGSDNCTLEANLIFTFEIGVDSTVTVYDCSDGGNEVTEVYAIDESGNSTQCGKVEIFITDTDDVCPPGFTGIIQGRVMSEFAELVDEYEVELHHDNDLILEIIESGPYTFEDLEFGESYTLSVTKNTGWKNGLTLLDYDMMVSHILQAEIFESPYQYIAADLDNNGKVSALDAVWLKRLLIDFSDEIGGNESWRFVNMYHDFDSSNPLLEEIPEIISFDPLLEDKLSADFLAIKTGDLDGDSKKSGFNGVEVRSYPSYFLETTNKFLEEGEEFNLELNLCNTDCKVAGIQLSLNFDKFEFVELSDISNSDYNYMEEKSMLKLMMSKLEYDFDKISQLSIKLRAKEKGQLKDLIADFINNDYSRVYDKDATAHIPSIKVVERIENYDQVELMLAPNPFYNEITLDLIIPYTGLTLVDVYDSYGRKVYSWKQELEAGKHQLLIKAEELSSAGIYNLIVSNKDNKINRKIILIN